MLSDFSKGINAFVSKDVLPLKYAVAAYNFDSGSGALKHSKGFDGVKLINGMPLAPLQCGIKKLYYFKRYDPENQKYDDKIIAYGSDKKLYYIDIDGGLNSFSLIEGAHFESTPSAINYRLHGEDVIILCSQYDLMTVWNGKNPPYTVESAPHISSACIHYERLFATVDGEKAAVWFSDDLDPTNWDISLEEAGYIEIMGEKGALLKVIKFLDYVYIFRSYGISRLTAYAEQTDFSVITLFVSSGKIYPDTVTVCGDRIIFMAQDGIFSFDGYNTVKIMEGIFPLISGKDNSKAVSAYYNGCCYIACNLNYGENDGAVNNTLIEYDINKKTISLIKGADISSITVVSTESYNNIVFSIRGDNSDIAVTLCEENRLFTQPLDKMWKTPLTDLNCPDKIKLAREIYLRSEEDISIKLCSEKGSKRVFLKGNKNLQKVPLFLKGREFELYFYSNTEKAYIGSPLIVADIL